MSGKYGGWDKTSYLSVSKILNLISVVLLSPKLICFEGKMNKHLNENNFLLLFPISSAAISRR